MGLGYGSEFQLMRFLGHHREELNDLIQKATGQKGRVCWKDFPYEKARKSGDGELKGIECFKGMANYHVIENAWKEFWPQGGSAMNWDGVFTIGDIWYFVEAKANKREAFQSCHAKDPISKRTIDTAMLFAKKWLNVTNKINWRRTNCYQLANRLAFAAFCNENAIQARILYVGFLNGYGDKGIESIQDWRQIWEDEYKALGITESDLKGKVYHIYPNCKQ